VTDHRTTADLREYLDAIDLCYFKGQLDDMGVEIGWIPARGPRGRIGQYWHDRKRIELARELASFEVPLVVVMSVIFHESLHAVLGPDHDDHGEIFRLLEGRFLHHVEAHLWERDNITKPWPPAPKGLR
jgi:hypothetical protein